MSPLGAGVITASGDLFPTVTGIASKGGVAMNAPPASILADVHRLVADAMKDIPADSHGALVGIATRKSDGRVNVNLAIATKVGSHVTVVGWLGKSWGQPIEGGTAVQVHF